MIRTLIIDDEESTINVVKLLLQKYVPAITEIHTAAGSAEGLQMIHTINPQLLFLDIEMPFMNGFELLQKFPSHEFEVIFITAYDHYAIKAIKYSALDYLLKPIDVEELKQAVQRFTDKQKNSKSQTPLLQNLMHNLHVKEETNYKLAISTNEGTFFYHPDDIIRCEALGNYTRFILREKKPLLTSKTLKEYEDLLSEKQFIRVHRTHLVNKKYINSYSGDHELKMSDGSVIEVSRRRWEAVKSKLNN